MLKEIGSAIEPVLRVWILQRMLSMMLKEDIMCERFVVFSLLKEESASIRLEWQWEMIVNLFSCTIGYQIHFSIAL